MPATFCSGMRRLATDPVCRYPVGLLCDLGVDTKGCLRVGVAEAYLSSLDVDAFLDQERRGDYLYSF